MPNETHYAPLRYNIPDFFSSLLGSSLNIRAAAPKYRLATLLQGVATTILRHRF